MKLKIAIDFDDVLFQYRETFLDYLNRENIVTINKKDVIGEIKLRKYLVEKGYINYVNLFFHYSRYVTESFRTGQKIKDSQQTLWDLYRSFDLVVISKRHAYEISFLKFFLKEYPYFHNYFLTSGAEKIFFLDSTEVDIFIDDELENCIMAAERNKFVLLLDAPHNQSSHPLPKNLKRVKSWKEIGLVLNKFV